MAEKILIIDDDLDTLRLVGLMLQKQGYQIVAANNGEQGLGKVVEENPDLILLDVMMPDMDGYEVARRLRQNPKTASIPILMFTAKSQLDDKVTGFESGADDYLTKPTHPTELQSHVKALLARSVKAQDAADSALPEKRAFVTGVVSVHGGLGVSSISLNLGSILQSENKMETIVAELMPGIGTMGRDLGIHDLSALFDLLKSTPREITSEKVSESLVLLKSGLKLLLASEQPRDLPLSEALPQFDALFRQLVALPRFLVLDFGASLPRVSQKLLPQCDHVVIPTEAFVNSIEQAKLLVKDLLELGLKEEQISIVLNNRVRSDMLLSLNQVEKMLGYSVAVTFTPAPELYAQANRMKAIPVLTQPESIVKQQFKNLAAIIVKNEAEE